MVSGTRDETEPGDRWEFDEQVADAFDDMLERSIPQFDVMRDLVSTLAARHMRPGLSALDLGCSRGGALAALLDKLGDLAPYRASPSRIVGLEISEPMLAAARRRFAGEELVEVRPWDLRQGRVPESRCGAVLSVLTLQFTPIEYRQRIVAACAAALAPGGALILVEKIMGATAGLDAEMVDVYYDRKREAGYSDEQIERKRLSLEGVLVPVTARWNEDLLTGAGFRDVDCVWRWCNFAAWLAVRS